VVYGRAGRGYYPAFNSQIFTRTSPWSESGAEKKGGVMNACIWVIEFKDDGAWYPYARNSTCTREEARNWCRLLKKASPDDKVRVRPYVRRENE